jgi:small-conductance mechanosensitive channel
MDVITDLLAAGNLRQLLVAAAIVLVFAMAGRILLYGSEVLLRSLARTTPRGLGEIIFRGARQPLFLLIVLIGAQLGLSQLQFLTREWQDFFANVLYAGFVVAGYLLCYRLIHDGLRWYTQEIAPLTATRLDEEVIPFFRRLLIVILTAIVFIMLLQRFGFDVTGLVATLGVGSLAIALAAQATLADAIAGFVILLDKPYRVGDRIALPEQLGGWYGRWGDVHRITLRNTRVRSTDGVTLIVPNSWMVRNTVVNFSHQDEPGLRVRIRVGVEPDWPNVERAMGVIEEVVNAHPDVVDVPKPPEVLVREIRDYDVLLETRFYIARAHNMRRIRSDLNARILRTFAEEGVRMSTPTQRVAVIGAPAGEASEGKAS